ncbi:DUF4271 domain-containing protein [Parabacteroides sp. 52]|uniref:DUF4271 domain-containing protein n=1 Tax=unclassified Parabacteroides TaxID=2649774 RepID=UPI0013D43C71|nr:MULTISPECIES: DUF4271 domain-containing protein [unclassified Parabacteroides]MDH6534406.1 hypothetical protein [Parabacteroides sp. PM5-20]NDV54905.1 DUF4271 domain-containing protein [Parabacteroides sp. 52]
MHALEGYTGIPLNDGQLVKDIVLTILLFLFIAFSLTFHFHVQLFMKMIKDVIHIKPRKSLFEIPVNSPKGNESGFRVFITLQALLLCTISLFGLGMHHTRFASIYQWNPFIILGILFTLLSVFFLLKQGLYLIFSWVFGEKEQHKLWLSSYYAITGLWGICLYIPAIWITFIDIKQGIPVVLFYLLYILCRFVIFYKSLRIFHIKRDGFLFISLYLCGQEILPLFLLYKGIIYLYNFIEMSTLWR